MLLQVGVQRQNHERQVYVHQAHDHRERREQKAHWPQPEHLEQGVERAGEHRLRSEYDHPGIHPDQKVAPERQDHEQQEQVAVALGAAGDQQRQRIAEQETKHRGGDRVPEGLEEQLSVERIREEALVILEREIDDRRALVSLLKQRRQTPELARIAKRGEHHDQGWDSEEYEQIEQRRTADQ